jgi:hypothetical protein
MYVVVAFSEKTTDTCCAVGTGIPTPIAPVCAIWTKDEIDLRIACVKCSNPGQVRLDNPYHPCNLFLLPDWQNAHQECRRPGAPKTEGAITRLRDRNLGRKGGAIYSYSKAKCSMVQSKRGVWPIIRRTEIEHDGRPLEEAEHLWMEDEKEVQTHRCQQVMTGSHITHAVGI